MQKEKFFISTKWRNREQLAYLTEQIRNHGFEVISFLEYPNNKESLARDPEEMMREWESIPEWQQNERIKRIAEEDKLNIPKCDSLILLLPAGISAHLEAGWAKGLGKKCILVGEPEKTESGYLMIFDQMFSTIEQFLEFLKISSA